ncbi:MAG: hypothetical protein AAGH15_01580 [Myxococcota bacterium]
MRIALLSLGLVLAACSSGPEVLDPDAAAEALVDRNWITTWPTSPATPHHVLRFVPSMGSSGVYQDRVLFEGSFELFLFRAEEGRLAFTFPGKDERHETPFRIEKVDGPAPFTHRLVLEASPRGPNVYYGYDESGGGHDLALDY